MRLSGFRGKRGRFVFLSCHFLVVLDSSCLCEYQTPGAVGFVYTDTYGVSLFFLVLVLQGARSTQPAFIVTIDVHGSLSPNPVC